MAFKLKGAAELDRQLQELGAVGAVKVMRPAVREALKPALTKAQSTVPVGSVPHRTYKGRLVAPGYASRSLRIAVSVLRDRSAVIGRLGVLKEAFYAVQFIELGTAKIPRRPWLRPAFEATISQQLETLSRALKKRIDKIAR